MPGWQQFVQFLEFSLGTLTTWTGSLAIAIILFTILTRLLLLPLTIKQLQSSRKMQALQPKMADLRRKYGKDQQKLTEEMTKLYREEKVNPAGSCLPLLIQLPIFIGVYQAVYNLVTQGGLNQSFLGINLGLAAWQPANDQILQAFPNFQPGFQGTQYLVLPILTVLLQLLTSLMATPKIQDPQQKAMTQALLFMPLVLGYINFTFNQGAVLYWVTGALLSVIQQFFVTGFGSLTNYLTFLPDRQGLFPPPVPATTVSSDSDGIVEPEDAKPDFWTPLGKLTASPAGAGATSDTATEQAITEAKRQGNKKRR
jgi:YidC/Oxa1 family membrane protein insertase